jgi:hypothetical protein
MISRDKGWSTEMYSLPFISASGLNGTQTISNESEFVTDPSP